jgi:23S rRNA pseudouridine2605 synthase
LKHHIFPAKKDEETTMMRLQKYLALSGVASRRSSEKLIADGHISVNGITVTEMGVQVDETSDRIEVDGKPVRIQEKKHYIAYHKPLGEVTTAHDPEGRATVMDKFADYPVRLYPVGRLDYDSEGLLLLTNDGDMMNHVLHPSHEVSKVYLTKVSNQVTDEEIMALRRGVMIDGHLTSPASVRLIRRETFDTVLLISIHEGRNRQVRKMLNAVGHQVVSLKRVGFGPVSLGDLPSGKWRHLSQEEIEKLKRL